MVTARDDLAAKIKDAYYHARDHGGTMHTAADDAADAILAAGWEHPATEVRHYRTGPGRCACGFDAYQISGVMVDYHEALMAHLRARRRSPA